MTETWPGALPERALRGRFNERPEANDANRKLPVGAPQMRHRSLIDSALINVTYFLTADELETFYDFYHDTLVSGTQPFEATDPRTQVTALFEFTRPPVVRAVDYIYYHVECELRKLPS
jgi:hypothetical protein